MSHTPTTMNNMNRQLLLFLGLLTFLIATAESKGKKPYLKDGLFKKSKFIPIEEFTDEFKGRRFDLDKWHDINPRWKGRQPGLFATKNVKQRRGELRLRGRYEKNDDAFEGAPEGYEKYTTAFVMTRQNAKYGYFEVRAKPGNSRLSSSFWGSLDTPKLWTEIDVYEIGGGAVRDGVDYRKRINMNLHVFRNKKRGIEPGKNEIDKPTYYTHRKKLRSKFNRYGVDWAKRYITWTFNGRRIRRDRNRHWKQAFPIKFDVETMPYWFGLPSKDTLPATYKIKYIRAWTRKRKRKNDEEDKTVRQLNTALLPISSLTAGTDNGSAEEDGGDDDEDEAVMEIEDMNTNAETAAPQDGLQRPPIPGSSERVYMPVTPFGGGSWAPFIEEVNVNLDDVAGAMFDGDEQIDMGDFDDEKVNFGRSTAPTAPSSGGGAAAAPAAAAPTASTAPAVAPGGLMNLPLGSLGRPDRSTPAPAPAPASGDAAAPAANSGGRGFGRVAGGLKLHGFFRR
ncbi:glycoside hydrolase [Gracilaria domingensis]|nr:glycoside hydrolase [Gracilaria domingensis]